MKQSLPFKLLVIEIFHMIQIIYELFFICLSVYRPTFSASEVQYIK